MCLDKFPIKRQSGEFQITLIFTYSFDIFKEYRNVINKCSMTVITINNQCTFACLASVIPMCFYFDIETDAYWAFTENHAGHFVLNGERRAILTENVYKGDCVWWMNHRITLLSWGDALLILNTSVTSQAGLGAKLFWSTLISWRQPGKEFNDMIVGLRPALEGFVVTMHEGACETGSQSPTA